MLFMSFPVTAELTMQEAETFALAEDPMLRGFQQRAYAFREQSVADGELPDPKIKLGLMSLPTDTFKFTQEPMTQAQIGVQQMFPAGDTLKHKSRKTNLMSKVEQSKAELQGLEVIRNVRKAWLESFYWVSASKVVRESQELFEQLIRITHSRYAVGGKKQQDIIRAELELEMLHDKEISIKSMEEKSRADLARWIGMERAAQPLSEQLPELMSVPARENIQKALEKHPAIDVENATVLASKQDVAIAREAYKPKWMLDVTYGARGGENADRSNRADFLSTMVVIDIPLFAEKRQDKRLAASQHRVTASMLGRDNRYRELQKSLDKSLADWDRLGERLSRYESTLLPHAKANAEASLNAYQSDQGDFTMLMRARITELNTRLQAVRLEVDRAKAQAELLYLAGEK